MTLDLAGDPRHPENVHDGQVQLSVVDEVMKALVDDGIQIQEHRAGSQLHELAT